MKMIALLAGAVFMTACATTNPPKVKYQTPINKGDTLSWDEALINGEKLSKEIARGRIEPYWVDQEKGVIGLRYAGVKQKDSLDWGAPQKRFLNFSISFMIKNGKLFPRWNGQTVELVLKQG